MLVFTVIADSVLELQLYISLGRPVESVLCGIMNKTKFFRNNLQSKSISFFFLSISLKLRNLYRENRHDKHKRKQMKHSYYFTPNKLASTFVKYNWCFAEWPHSYSVAGAVNGQQPLQKASRNIRYHKMFIFSS